MVRVGDISTVPHQLIQLYAIHGINYVRNVVGAYCLLTNKSQETDAEVLRQLENLTNNVVPHSIIIDFEQHVIAALNQRYPLVPQKGLSLKKVLFYLSKKANACVFKNFGSQWLLLDF